jgi:hypothetical protein
MTKSLYPSKCRHRVSFPRVIARYTGSLIQSASDCSRPGIDG